MSLNKTKVSQPLQPAEVIKLPGPVHALSATQTSGM